MTSTGAEIDQARAEAFGGRMLDILNGASLTLMVAIGYETGLFDKMAGQPPSTSEQLASIAGLNERYVREWLGAMVTGRIVEYDPASATYVLPHEHAASLTRAAGTNNLSSFAAFYPEYGKVTDKVAGCFRTGGGVPYSEYERFQELMRNESAQVFDAALIRVTLPLVPGLVERLKAGIDVADVGCGAGHAINLMARAFPNSNFVGYDFGEDGIALARAEARQMGLTNASFEVRDAAQLGINGRFDFITVFDAVHDQAQPAAMLSGIYDALKPGADFLCVDIQASSKLEENLENPLAPMLYSISTLHCMTVSLAYGGVGLGTVWGEQKALQMLAEAGFRDLRVEHVEGDAFNNYYIARK
jgi:ubiquinone/menaquinone biosynthesis C-methylase UbiE